MYFTIVRYVIYKFKSSTNKYSKKHRVWVRNGDIETDTVGREKYSIRKRTNLLDISKTIVARILKSNTFRPYKL